uniref:G-protein coupled receptors family 1 profile domain-containing protein n=2 Tax=Strongyloides stercoralis TaxID=6248 RepID=A0A0K0DV71_STRER
MDTLSGFVNFLSTNFYLLSLLFLTIFMNFIGFIIMKKFSKKTTFFYYRMLLYYQSFNGIIYVILNSVGKPRLLLFNDYSIYYIEFFKYFQSKKYIVIIYWIINSYLICNELTIVTTKIMIRDLIICKNFNYTIKYFFISIFVPSLITLMFTICTLIFFNETIDVNTTNFNNHTLENNELINFYHENFIILQTKLFERIFVCCCFLVFFIINYIIIIIMIRKYFVFLKNHNNLINVKTKDIACSLTKTLIVESVMPCILYSISIITIIIICIGRQDNIIKNIGTLTIRILIIGPLLNSLISIFVNRNNRHNLKGILNNLFCCRNSNTNTVIPDNRFTQRSIKASQFPVSVTRHDSRFALF